MKILFTGASSFTGYWFVRELAAAGHEMVMTLRQPPEAYEGVRRQRVDRLADLGRVVHLCSFGDERFVALINEANNWDMLCHHAAEVSNYKSPDFDVAAALANNTRAINQVLGSLAAHGCPRVLLTGSIFEPGEGAGSEGLSAFSPYGLSKGLTADCFAYYAAAHQMRLGKLVIPNPFGPFEEPRFTQYLVRLWYEGKTPAVNTPAYVRDNIHVSLLAKAYADFAGRLPTTPGFEKLNPTGYIETQGAFAQRFAEAMRSRLDLPCELELKRQTEFTEPRIRINTDPLDAAQLGWDEQAAWDALGSYYRELFASKVTSA